MIRPLTTFFYPILRRIRPRLKARHELQNVESGVWQATGTDPRFSIHSPLLRLLSGWISITVSMRSEDVLHPKVYLDFGEGFSESRAITLYQTSEEHYRAEITLPAPIRAMRFDPNEGPCRFEIGELRIRAHSEWLHIARQFCSISYNDYRNGISPRRIYNISHVRYKKHGIEGMLERLDKEYKRLHPYRVQRSTSQHIAYLNWIRVNERDITDPLPESATYRPLVSVVMPVYNAPIRFLREAIESVIAQSYPNWELCIADDASTEDETRHLLNHYRERYENIHVYFRHHNGHISKATNTALGLAKGEYVAFMDHDDTLAPHALKEVVMLLNDRPDLQLIYSDEDKIDEEGQRYDPHFKSGWNPDMLLSQNYISHLCVMRRELVEKLGGVRSGVEGAQDHDLLLRAMAHLKDDKVGRVEKILYHWRSLEGSTARDAGQKEYTTRAGVKAQQEYFDEAVPGAVALEGELPNTYHPLYPIPGIAMAERVRPWIGASQINEEIFHRLSTENTETAGAVAAPLVSIIIPTRDGYDILSKCIGSILEKTTYPNYEILVVDNQSRDAETLAYLEEIQRRFDNICVLKYEKPFNYSAINNFAVARAKGELVVLLNNDVEVIVDEWLDEMAQYALRPEIGAVGAKLHYDDGTIQHGGVILGIGGVAGHSHKYHREDHYGYFSRLRIVQNYSAVTGACLLVRKTLYNDVGGLDESFEVAFNDIDFSLRLQRSGYRNLWTPYARLFHHESKTRGQDDTAEKAQRFSNEVARMKARWNGMLDSDRFYNKNLSDTDENFSIRTRI